MKHLPIALLALLTAAQAGAQSTSTACAGSRDLRLVNGRIVTLDKKNSTVAEATIQNGDFTAVGRGGSGRLSPCTRTIDLRGRTAVPGPGDHGRRHARLADHPDRRRGCPARGHGRGARGPGASQPPEGSHRGRLSRARERAIP